MNKFLPFLITLNVLLRFESTLDWQGTGNMSSDNLTVIWDYIHNNFKSDWTYNLFMRYQDQTLINFTTGLSDQLNKRWDPAWNVVAVANNGHADAVLYGYAFRDHWLWYNGYLLSGGVYTMSFLIWKDYNCLKWMNLGDSATYTDYDILSATGFYITALQPVVSASYSLNPKGTNIWQAAYNLGNLLATDPKTSSKAFTIIGSEQSMSLFGRVCATNFCYTSVIGGAIGSFWGSSYILQMR